MDFLYMDIQHDPEGLVEGCGSYAISLQISQSPDTNNYTGISELNLFAKQCHELNQVNVNIQTTIDIHTLIFPICNHTTTASIAVSGVLKD